MANLAHEGEPDLRMSRDDYRRWAEAQARGRFERVDGVVVAMAPERASHADQKALIWLALRQAVAAAGLPCHSNPMSSCIVHPPPEPRLLHDRERCRYRQKNGGCPD